MILRVIRGRGQQPEVEALRADLAARLGPGSGVLEGPTRFHLGTRPAGDGVEVLLIVSWESAEAVARAEARGVTPFLLAAATLSEVRAATFELDASILRRSDLAPVALRIATGKFSRPGSDIEMQELLRQRAPDVGEEMLEAYVGRRLVDHSIEVTFVSAWQRIPEGRNLEDPFWSDIALRYDEFSVEVYTALAIEG